MSTDTEIKGNLASTKILRAIHTVIGVAESNGGFYVPISKDETEIITDGSQELADILIGEGVTRNEVRQFIKSRKDTADMRELLADVERQLK